LDGKVKRITVSRSASGKFYASAIVEMEDTKHLLPSTGKAVGVDMGVRNLVTIHDSVCQDKVELAGVIKSGKSEGMKQRLEHIQILIRRVQRHLSRKTEHRKRDKKERSKRQEKCRIRLARLKEKEAFIRSNLLHEISCGLTNQYDTICIEDLAVKNMSRTAKGTVEEPGKNVKAKQGLNRVIVNSGLAMLRTQIEYKAAQKGRKVVVVSRWEPSSKNCSNCGFKNEKLGSKTKWTCNNCGTDHDRDLNAAKNILAAGIAASDVLTEYSRRAERKTRTKKTGGRVSVEAITPENYPKKKEQKSRTKRMVAPQGVSDG
jgi:putative transposase